MTRAPAGEGAPDAGKRPLVTAVVPAFNAEGSLGDTLHSICRQTWRELEIVVVDDGSTDGTVALVEAAAEHDPRIRLIRQANAGAAAARNHGTRESRGSYLAFCDSDDIWHPQKIADQMERMEALGPRCGLVYTLSRTIDTENRVLAPKGVPGFEGAAFLRHLIVNFVGNGSAILVRREAIEEAGGYDETLKNCEDWHVQAAIVAGWDVGAVNRYLTGYRMTPGSKSTRNKLRHRHVYRDALRKILDREPAVPRDVIDAAEAAAYCTIVIEHLRGRDLVNVSKTFMQGARHSPRVMLDVIGRRLYNVLAGRNVGPTVTGQDFFDADPDEPIGRSPPLKLPWLVRRLEAREAEFRKRRAAASSHRPPQDAETAIPRHRIS